jgi:hypothetical protein
LELRRKKFFGGAELKFVTRGKLKKQHLVQEGGGKNEFASPA